MVRSLLEERLKFILPTGSVLQAPHFLAKIGRQARQKAKRDI